MTHSGLTFGVSLIVLCSLWETRRLRWCSWPAVWYTAVSLAVWYWLYDTQQFHWWFGIGCMIHNSLTDCRVWHRQYDTQRPNIWTLFWNCPPRQHLQRCHTGCKAIPAPLLHLCADVLYLHELKGKCRSVSFFLNSSSRFIHRLLFFLSFFFFSKPLPSSFLCQLWLMHVPVWVRRINGLPYSSSGTLDAASRVARYRSITRLQNIFHCVS